MALPALLAGGLTLASLLKGNESPSGTNVESREPAARDNDQQKLWDEFMDNVFGSTFGEEIGDISKYYLENPEAQKYIKDKVDRDIESGWGQGQTFNSLEDLRDKYAKEYYLTQDPASRGSLTQPGLEERIGQDLAVQKQADIGAASQLMGLMGTKLFEDEASGTDLINAITQSNRSLSNEQNPLINSLRPTATSAPINLSFGDFSTPYTTGTQRNAIDQFTQLTGDRGTRESDLANLIYEVDTGQSANKYDLGAGLAGVLNQIDKTYTPNAANRQFLDYITPINMNIEALRYGSPTTTSSASYQQPTNILGSLGQGVNVAQGLMDLFSGGV